MIPGGVDIVIPSVGRPSLAALLRALTCAGGALPERIIVVDDRRAAAAPLFVGWLPGRLRDRLRIVRGRGAGPAAARNTGWHEARARWVAFLDDDVVPGRDWPDRLAADLCERDPAVGAVTARIRVPLPHGRPPTDWERTTAGLEGARWITADLAVRRDALVDVGGFDERFPRAFREDSDLALRLVDAGWEIAAGSRTTSHPVRPAGDWVSLRSQAGNADDALMERLWGRGWYARAGAPVGRRSRHLATSALTTGAAVAAIARRPALAAAATLGAAGLVGAFAAERIGPGPRDRAELRRMALTSAAIPYAATWHWLYGLARARALAALPGPDGPRRGPGAYRMPAAVLLDRDGTLVVDVPYNADPARVTAMPAAREALDRLRGAGVPTAVVSNQSGVGRGLIEPEALVAVQARVEELLGPLGPWLVCPHTPEALCDCRKPRPGLVVAAAEVLGVPVERCAVIGDIAADVEAARAVGARAVLVPSDGTSAADVEAAREVAEVAPTLGAAVDLLLGSRSPS